MRTTASVIWTVLFCVMTHTELSVIDAKIIYAELGQALDLNCGCLSKSTRSQAKRWYSEDGLITQSTDDWGPRLLNGGEILRVQSVRNLYKNVTYECRADQENGSQELCQKYTVQAFQCRPNTESVEPQNVTNLEVGDSPTFTCTQYFACDKVNEIHSVSMRTNAKHSKIMPCTVSDHGLKYECKLQILNITEEDFSKAVECVVNDSSGAITVYKAFPFKKDFEIRQQKKIIIAVSVLCIAVVPVLALIIFLKWFLCKQKYRSRYRFLSPMDCCNPEYKNNSQILVYSVLEEDDLLSTRLSPLNKLLQTYEYKTFDKDVNVGCNITEAFSELASKSLALIIVVDVGLLKSDNLYKNKFKNVLESKAAKGECRIRPYYTSILYNHENCCERGVMQCHEKHDQEKKFVSFDIKGDQTDVENVIEKLKKRLPPIPDSASYSESMHRHNSTVPSNTYYNSCVSTDCSVNRGPYYSRMESYMSCSSDTPLFMVS